MARREVEAGMAAEGFRVQYVGLEFWVFRVLEFQMSLNPKNPEPASLKGKRFESLYFGAQNVFFSCCSF